MQSHLAGFRKDHTLVTVTTFQSHNIIHLRNITSKQISLNSWSQMGHESGLQR